MLPPNFYPRPPRGGRLCAHGPVSFSPIFLSTPSARRATRISGKFRSNATDFYPRPPRGGRPVISWGVNKLLGDFYPRPPRGGRRAASASALGVSQFLSTPSARRATSVPTARSRFRPFFYPRPPRGGRLVKPSLFSFPTGNFYPRPPRGGRLLIMSMPIAMSAFLSTPSARRATG